MYLRSNVTAGGSVSLNNHSDEESYTLLLQNPSASNKIGESSNTINGGGTTLTKKMLLWLILLLQLLFIACFWLLQANLTNDMPMEQTIISTKEAVTDSLIDSNKDVVALRVHFITKPQDTTKEVANKRTKPEERQFENVNNVTKDFCASMMVVHQLKRLRTSQRVVTTANNSLLCYKDGSVPLAAISYKEENILQEDCQCLPGWHGHDCSQPEVIWRSLMTMRRQQRLPLRMLNTVTSAGPHHLVVLLQGYFLSKEMLELQLGTLSTVADAIVIFVTHRAVTTKMLRNIERVLDAASEQHGRRYLIIHCSSDEGATIFKNRTKFKNADGHVRLFKNNCTAVQAYAAFRKYHRTIGHKLAPNDLLLYAANGDHTLFSQRALKFLKYYADTDSSMTFPNVNFRLKYNVYGFYWQHPKRTHLSGVLTTIGQLDNVLPNHDPFLQLTTKHDGRDVVVVGDLNHYGGWYCQHCEQPEEIIAELHLIAAEEVARANALQISDSSSSMALPSLIPRRRHINVAHIQRLVALGIDLSDGRTRLLKLRSASSNLDRFDQQEQYAPNVAMANNAAMSRYAHLLINLYEMLDDDDAGDGEADAELAMAKDEMVV